MLPMATIVRPDRKASFSGQSRVAGDQLDIQINNLIEAIHSTQLALEELRRDDGRLRNESVGLDQLHPSVGHTLLKALKTATEIQALRAEQGAAVVKSAEQNAELFAKDAEAAAFSAAQFLTAVNAAQAKVIQRADVVENDADFVSSHTTEAENWANHSQAQAENSKAEQQQAAAWAEYLAGPVVNHDDAPAYISGTPYGRGLYYQPVEGYGGVAGLWSAKWWAIHAAQLVGPWSIYYLGGWSDPPIPGSINPDTGLTVPNPLPPGSIYYDIEDGVIYVWNGSEWKSPYALASGVSHRFVYQASDDQIAFSGPDMNGATPTIGESPSDIHLNGVKLVPELDYTIDSGSSILTLSVAAPLDSIVQWDLLVPTADLVPGNVHNFKAILTPSAPDGTNRIFTLQYPHPVGGLQPVEVTDGDQLQVSIDGIIQEPGVDYSADEDVLTMSVAPAADARFWVVWFSNAVLTR
jgi:hypothetical protein